MQKTGASITQGKNHYGKHLSGTATHAVQCGQSALINWKNPFRSLPKIVMAPTLSQIDPSSLPTNGLTMFATLYYGSNAMLFIPTALEN
mmetsp:Transcript_26119/g.37468  ORF Transcript_26119/g.37468 Transcript_26119/m.37468 type:complete len:89 (+) Transcript_26119:840-1106(+)